MSIRSTVLFTPEGRAAEGLFRLWRQQGATQPLQVGARLIEEDRSATRFFRALWGAAFASRDSLPLAPLANPDGTGSDVFWERFS